MNPKALIIEDNRNMANAFSEALNLAGYQVQIAHDGVTALTKVAIESFDLVLLDIHLPLIKGDILLEKIRMSVHMTNSRIVLVTADDKRANELSDIADLVLIKPIGFSELRDIAKAMIPKSAPRGLI